MLNNSKSVKAPSRATPLWLPIACVVLFGGKLIAENWEKHNPLSFHDHVQWRNLEQGKQEARSRHMPIFEVVTSDYQSERFKSLERYYFSDPALANNINKNYVPVRSLSKTSNNRWEPTYVNEKNSDNKIDFASVRIVPIDLQDRSCDDYRLPHLYVGPGWKPGMLNFLNENKTFQYSYNTAIAKHNWSKLANVEASAKKENKKILYFFFRQYDDTCYNVMRYPFDDFEKKKLIEKNFASALVLDRDSPSAKNPKYINELIKKYGVISYPTLVSVNEKTGKFQKLGGTSNRSEIDEFLKKETTH